MLAPLGYWATLTAVNGRRREGEPPLVRGALPYLGVAVRFGTDATAFVQQCREQHGDVFTLFVAGKRMTFVLDPLSAPSVLKAKQLDFHPVSDHILHHAFKMVDPRGKVDMDAIERLGRTRLRGEPLEVLTKNMAAQLREILPGAAPQEWGERDLYRLIWDVVFRAGTESLFGRGVTTDALARNFEVFDRQFPVMAAGLPRRLVRDGERALDALANSRLTGTDCSQWIRDRQPYLEAMPADERGYARIPVLWAIHANTIPACFWSLYNLLRTPRALQAIRAELDGLSAEARRALDPDTLDGLRMLDSAVRESLRLSSGSLTVREVLEPFTLETGSGAHCLRAGDRVCLAPFVTHRDPEIFEDPLTYRFDRFYAPTGRKQFYKRGQRVPLPLMPFGAGVSMCPGRFFAMNEIKLFVAMAVSQWNIELLRGPIPDFEYRRAGLGIYPPAHDVPVRLRREI